MNRILPRLGRLAFSGVAVPLGLFAGPYRTLAFRPRSFGDLKQGATTWAGVVFAFPAWVLYYGSPMDLKQAVVAIYAWGALGIACYTQMFIQWCSSNRERRDAGAGHFWLGRGEWAFAAALAGACWYACGRGAGSFVLLGYGTSIVLVTLHRIRRRCAAWSDEDTRRLTRPARACGRLARSGGRHAASLTTRCAHAAAPVASAGYACLWRLAAGMITRRRVATAEGAAPYRPPGFWGRVSTFVMGHLILSLIGGGLLLKILSLPFALFLWLIGYKVTLPEDVRQLGRSILSRGAEALQDEVEEVSGRVRKAGDDVADRLRRKGKAVAERIEDAREDAAERFHLRRQPSHRGGGAEDGPSP